MIELIISLALAAVLLLFVVFGLLWGLKRGLKKTLFRAAWLAVTAVLLFVFTPMITRAVMNADLSALDLNVGGEQVTTLQEYVVTLLGQDADLGQIAADNPQAVSSLVQIASLAFQAYDGSNSAGCAIFFSNSSGVRSQPWALASAMPYSSTL